MLLTSSARRRQRTQRAAVRHSHCQGHFLRVALRSAGVTQWHREFVVINGSTTHQEVKCDANEEQYAQTYAATQVQSDASEEQYAQTYAFTQVQSDANEEHCAQT